jgi:hypothetical protein
MGNRYCVILPEYPAFGTAIRYVKRSTLGTDEVVKLPQTENLADGMVVGNIDVVTDVCGSRYTVERVAAGYAVSGWFGPSGIIEVKE